MKHIVFLTFAAAGALLLGIGVFWLREHPGVAEMTWLGYRIQASVSLVAGAGFLALCLLLLVAVLVLGQWQAYRVRRLRRFNARTEQGLDTLTRALVLMSVGEEKEAVRYLERASKKLGRNSPLVHLLQAGIARREGNAKAFDGHLQAMLDAPSTQPLAALTLANQSKATGKLEEAAAYIEKSEHSGVLQRGTAKALLDIYHRGKRWQEANALVQRMLKSGALQKSEAHHYRAVLHYLQALAQQEESSRRHLEAAFRESSGFIPAAVALAKHWMSLDVKKARQILTQSWAQTPHPDLAKLFMQATQEMPDRARLAAAKSLTAKTSSSVDSQLLLAEVHLTAKNWDQARNHLKAALAQEEQGRIYEAMARLEQQETGQRETVMSWLGKITTARPSSSWVCDACAQSHGAWQPVCDGCDQFASLHWGKAEKLKARVAGLLGGSFAAG